MTFLTEAQRTRLLRAAEDKLKRQLEAIELTRASIAFYHQPELELAPEGKKGAAK